MEVRSVRRPDPMTRSLLEGLCSRAVTGQGVDGAPPPAPGLVRCVPAAAGLQPAERGLTEAVGGEWPVPTRGDVPAAVRPGSRLG